MRTDKNLIRTAISKALLLAVTAILTPFCVMAQDNLISLPDKELTASEVFKTIENQTDFRFMVDSERFDATRKVKITKSPVSISAALGQIFEGSGMTYAMDGKYLIVPIAAPIAAPAANEVPALGTLSGILADVNINKVYPKVAVTVVGTNKKATTDDKGYFEIKDIAEGVHALRLEFQQPDTVLYRDALITPGTPVRKEIFVSLDNKKQSDNVITITPAEKRKVVPVATKRDTSNDKQTYVLVEPNANTRSYHPKFALKTNILYLATTTPNIAAEFYLAPRWTLNVAAGYNPWDLNSRNGGIRHVLVQPEARYWFCNAFERHFIGVHGLYGRFQVADVKLPLVKDLTGKRYDGWGVGVGIAYGYHLPIAPRLALEFSVGVGYVWLNYKQYDCGDCDKYLGKYKSRYFGPTKAAVSLVWIIK